MCTAYEIGKKASLVPPSLAIDDDLIRMWLTETRIIRPTLFAPTILSDRSIQKMSWGFRRQFKGKSPDKVSNRTIVNSREDKLRTMTWRDAFENRRCIIPASAFYEWTDVGGGRAVPLRFESAEDKMLWIAGIWEENNHGPCYSMITTEPNVMVQSVHDRMPAVLMDHQIAPYLDHQLHELGPSGISLKFEKTENFLRSDPAKPSSSSNQEFLF